MDRVTENRVRPVTIEDLGIDISQPDLTATVDAEDALEVSLATPEVEKLKPDDAILLSVQRALDLGFAGVLLSGPPGTGKSYYAERIAHTLAVDDKAIATVQFHASYQYEDFMQGYVPIEPSGFALRDKIFVQTCKSAIARPDLQHVLLIDEISRCDVTRVFGEALTYLETDKRGRVFTLASGDPLAVPRNLVILATMNPWDKGVDDLDIALERRFAQIDMLPDVDALREILTKKGSAPEFIGIIAEFFSSIQKLDDEMVRLGHAYFGNCVDPVSSHAIWKFRLHPFFKKACRLNRDLLSRIEQLWVRTIPPTVPQLHSEEEAGLNAVPPDETQA
jgi:5-methylcytosine-specific restriction protein B